MKYFVFILYVTLYVPGFAQQRQQEVQRWETIARDVTIIRDNWGIPHIYGRTDADAVFGLMYAQCEDDFNRIEMNYIEKLGKLAMVEGESLVYNDLYTRLVIDEQEAKNDYEKGPAWLRKLLNAFADGINYYLYKHPETKPKLLTRFEPWYPLLWTDGSIGAISTGGLTPQHVRQFYEGGQRIGHLDQNPSSAFEITTGSNGFAVAGTNSATGNAMLYINPHVTLYFRPEVHMVSDEGLNAYGAVTWGQFFIYQGFNEYNGWMHTSSDVDVSDLYLEKITKQNQRLYYQYDGKQKPITTRKYSIQYKTDAGMKTKLVTTYSTHHGPVMSHRGEHWISVRSNNRSMNGLIQSWQRSKTKGFEDYKKVMDLRANTSNNTVYADHQGNIAYWHGNYVPIRDPKLNWAKPVDGTTSSTEWKGLHTVEEAVHLYNPKGGWIQNCNSTPFTAAGADSPKATDYPRYMAPDGENYRGINAVRLFSNKEKFNLDDLITLGYDRYLAAFENLVPALTKAYQAQRNDSATLGLHDAIMVMQQWDFKADENSVATTLAVEWGQQLIPRIRPKSDESDYEYIDQIETTEKFLQTASNEDLLVPFRKTIDNLVQTHGTWQIPWGELNRYQRLTSDIKDVHDDLKPSLPVAFTSSVWGMLPSHASRVFPGTKKRYVWGGNSFVCAVEFGKKIRAKSLLAGGVSGNPESPHFNDQGEMYAKGLFKDVLFYKDDVLRGAKRSYHPGQ